MSSRGNPGPSTGRLLSLFISTIIMMITLSLMLPVVDRAMEGMVGGSPPPEPEPVDWGAIADSLINIIQWWVPRIAIGIAVVWLARRAYKRRQHSLRTFGTTTLTAVDTREDPGVCVNCWSQSDEPYVIAYGRKYILFGVVVWRRVDGEVLECENCRQADEIEYAQRAADPAAEAAPVQEGAA